MRTIVLRMLLGLRFGANFGKLWKYYFFWLSVSSSYRRLVWICFYRSIRAYTYNGTR